MLINDMIKKMRQIISEDAETRCAKVLGIEEPKLVYKDPYQFNRIKYPEDRFLSFNREYIGRKKIGTHCAILNDAWTIDLRQKKISNLKGNMFSEREAKFILESAETDLKNLISQQCSLVQEISRYGERLGKMRTARDNLESIVKKLKVALKNGQDEDEEEDEDEDDDE